MRGPIRRALLASAVVAVGLAAFRDRIDPSYVDDPSAIVILSILVAFDVVIILDIAGGPH